MINIVQTLEYELMLCLMSWPLAIKVFYFIQNLNKIYDSKMEEMFKCLKKMQMPFHIGRSLSKYSE